MRRFAAVALVFLAVFESWVVGVDYAGYFARLIEIEQPFFSLLTFLACILSIFLSYRLLKFALSASPLFKVILFGLMAISMVVEYGYQKALGRFSDPADLETALTAPPEQQIASISMYVSKAVLIPALLLLVAMILVRAEKPQRLRGFAVTVPPIFLAFALFPLVIDSKFPTLATSAFLRTLTELAVQGTVENGEIGLASAAVHRREVTAPTLPNGYKPARNVILVVDESLRGDHLSLNGYARQTTPLLDKLASQSLLHNWNIAAAASTGSRFSYAALITGLAPDDFPDRSERKVKTSPTLFQYAKAMRYTTWFFDGQMPNYWGPNGEDRMYIDHWQGILDVTEGKAFEPWQIDGLIARKIHAIISSSSGNFIFVFTHGSHIPYQSDFPADAAVWTPSYTTKNKYDIPSADLLPQVVNAYDNSIRHTTEAFFSQVIDDYTAIPPGTIIVYTGDHGQTLFANGRASHGGNTKEEALVPLFIIGRLPAPVDTAYKASHGNIFPTILDLLDYPSELREAPRFPSLLRARRTDSRPRFFNPDLGSKVPFD